MPTGDTPMGRHGVARMAIASILATTFVGPTRSGDGSAAVLCWQPVDIELSAEGDWPWWEFPVTARLVHSESGRTVEVEGFWSGPRRQTIRFSAPVAGRWRYETRSVDPGLDGVRGGVVARAPTSAELARNPNLRGQVRVAVNGRHFEYADGTDRRALRGRGRPDGLAGPGSPGPGGGLGPRARAIEVLGLERWSDATASAEEKSTLSSETMACRPTPSRPPGGQGARQAHPPGPCCRPARETVLTLPIPTAGGGVCRLVSARRRRLRRPVSSGAMGQGVGHHPSGTGYGCDRAERV